MLEKYKQKIKKIEKGNSYFLDGDAGPIQVPVGEVKKGGEYIVLPIVSGGQETEAETKDEAKEEPLRVPIFPVLACEEHFKRGEVSIRYCNSGNENEVQFIASPYTMTVRDRKGNEFSSCEFCRVDRASNYRMKVAAPFFDLSDAVLSGADLSGADLRRADLSDADLSDAVLSDADLSDAVLSDAVLSDAVLSGAVLSGADLSGADLRRADLSDADLRRAVLSDADLSDADLRRADLRRADLRRARYLDSALGVSKSVLKKWCEANK